MRLFVDIMVGIVIWTIVPIFICILLANRKGLPPDKASRMGCLLGWIAVLIYLFKPDA